MGGMNVGALTSDEYCHSNLLLCFP